MTSRRILALLVGGLAVLLVAFAVLMAFYALLSALGDAPAARALLWTAVASLILLLIDLLLLVGILGLDALQGHGRDDDR